MIELKSKTYRVKLNADGRICDRFRDPIIFYLVHKDDGRGFFVNFAILDFARAEIACVITFLPENREFIANHPEEKKLRMTGFDSPHGAVQVTPGESFLHFVEHVPYFYHVDYRKNAVRVYTGKDLPFEEGKGLVEFGATHFKDDGDEEYFYLSAACRTEGGTRSYFYRVSLDLASYERVLDLPVGGGFAPHMTRKHKGALLISEFSYRELKLESTGEVFGGPTEFMRYVYEDLYREYCAGARKGFAPAEFFALNTIEAGKVRLEPQFAEFCRTKGTNLLALCRNSDKYRFSALPGKVYVADLKAGTVNPCKTTVSSAAHFELRDPSEDIVYTSSHNIVMLDRIYILGPAAIDKFLLREGTMTKLGCFSDPLAYRFTTHRIFEHRGKTYICSFGQPNRLFFIDAETMRTVYHDDIEGDVLSGRPDVCGYLNETLDRSILFRALEVSRDGEIVFLLGYRHIYFYSFPERRILAKIDYRSMPALDSGIDLNEFKTITPHSDYLR